MQTGKPGVIVFDGTPLSIKTFLEHTRGQIAFRITNLIQTISGGLRYLDFHHVNTRLFPNYSKRLVPRIADAKPGLQEVNMNELVKKLQDVDEHLKMWFRSEMGMGKG